jgi:hypothetical protein
MKRRGNVFTQAGVESYRHDVHHTTVGTSHGGSDYKWENEVHQTEDKRPGDAYDFEWVSRVRRSMQKYS